MAAACAVHHSAQSRKGTQVDVSVQTASLQVLDAAALTLVESVRHDSECLWLATAREWIRQHSAFGVSVAAQHARAARFTAITTHTDPPPPDPDITQQQRHESDDHPAPMNSPPPMTISGRFAAHSGPSPSDHDQKPVSSDSAPADTPLCSLDTTDCDASG